MSASTLQKIALVVLLLCIAMSTRAAVSIDTWLTDFSCSVTDSSGITVGIPCDGASVSSEASASAFLDPGESVQVTATLHIVYADDGLRLTTPRPVFGGRDRVGELFNEAGLVYLRTTRSDCAALRGACTLTPTAATFGPFPLVVGDNTFAESFEQEIAVTSGWINSSAPNSHGSFLNSGGATASLSVSSFSVTNPVTPVPEPAHSALLIAGLIGLWLRSRSSVRSEVTEPFRGHLDTLGERV
jgi:hypothetical protein